MRPDGRRSHFSSGSAAVFSVLVFAASMSSVPSTSLSASESVDESPGAKDTLLDVNTSFHLQTTASPRHGSLRRQRPRHHLCRSAAGQDVVDALPKPRKGIGHAPDLGQLLLQRRQGKGEGLAADAEHVLVQVDLDGGARAGELVEALVADGESQQAERRHVARKDEGEALGDDAFRPDACRKSTCQ
ncbi:hypothetical protein PpBr36_03999 [Pyricularia pennisetigena]|uniref:hypothetical protein n=1 Tax=Pyricularia pennisetigena TaxID=1578925 RepID=UPI00114F0ED8|nr:hypothetical protein PpBr36_03999 [Pyricularia pennisetigena]TLS26645.1 hypothetical protein PpBr36_03999 [Pyricularia pennisetigena]